MFPLLLQNFSFIEKCLEISAISKILEASLTHPESSKACVMIEKNNYVNDIDSVTPTAPNIIIFCVERKS